MLTPVGMFLMILAGLDDKKIMQGALAAYNATTSTDLTINSAALYACYRHYLHTEKHMQIENLCIYDPVLKSLGEQFRQSFDETEGKQHKSLFTTCSLYTTDLHSLGQYFQEGTRNFFETTLFIDNPKKDLIFNITDNDDNLEYLNGKTLFDVTVAAFKGTVKAHTHAGNVDNIVIHTSYRNETLYGFISM
jgi:glucose-6-phosphate isomerase